MNKFIDVVKGNDYSKLVDYVSTINIEQVVKEFKTLSPLWYMKKSNEKFNEYVFTFLIDVCEADIDTKNEDGQTLLIYCIEKGYTNMIDMLISNDCDLNLQDNVGMSALHYAVYNLDVNTVKLLLLSEIDVSLKDNCKQTALDYIINGAHHQFIDDPESKRATCFKLISTTR